MKSKATTVAEYLDGLPEDRRPAIETVREVILKNLPKGCEEGIQYGMIGYFVPHSVYPDGYHCDPKQPLPFAHLASQKNHMAVYMMVVYGYPGTEKWFRDAWAKTGKKLDMGKSCIRFKRLEDLPLKVIGQAIKRVSIPKYIAHYEATIKSPSGSGPKKTAKKKATKKKATKKKATPAKNTVKTKKVAAKKRTPTKKKVTAKKKATGKKAVKRR